MKVIIACCILLAVAVSAQEVPAVTPAPAVVVVATTQNPEKVKLASNDWKNYRGCDDTCLSLCLANPAEYDNKCSTLFSNKTVAAVPTSDSCRKAEAVQSCTYQCLCTCKRCGFCKRDLVNACSEEKNSAQCLDHVIDNIITNNKCD